MAQMIPNRLRVETKSQAEKILYQAFRDQLTDDFTVFHHVAWQVPSQCGGARDGETDFVIAHPNLGLLVLEVKGGQIEYDGAAARWYTNGNPLDKDPFDQANDAKHSLMRLLRSQPGWPRQHVTFGHAVAFPDIKIEQSQLRLDAPRAIVMDGKQLTGLDSWMRAVLRHWHDSYHVPIENEGIAQLRQLLSPSLSFKPFSVAELEPPLGGAITTEAEQLLELTTDQFEKLDFLAHHRRAAISGCAGSGKTILAVEKARRLSQQGFQILLTCFNRNLAEFLAYSLRDETGIKVAHFHGLAAELVRKAELWPGRGEDTTSQGFFNDRLPELMVAAADLLNWRVDALIVDEGQDFYDNWWVSLQYLLKEPDDGILYVFYDDHQNLYRPDKQPIPLETAPFPLLKNCRNTQAIHKFVRQFYRATNDTKATGPAGREVELLYYTSPTELKTHLRRQLHKLIIEQRVVEEDIVVLTTKAQDKSELWKFGPLGNFQLVETPSDVRGEILATTVYQFKGLESPVVILVEIDLDYPDYNTLMYVGASRACNHLIVIQPSKL